MSTDTDKQEPSATVRTAMPTPQIMVTSDGPLVVTGAIVNDHLGCDTGLGPSVELCRCGVSDTQPVCDRACERTGFRDSKDPERVPDRRDSYPGVQVTVLDNRGICQHSGLCTDRLANVFHAASDPFVTPSGGRMDEIIRAVRDCPSGALSYAVDNVEAREQVDWNNTRVPAVEITQDGPYRVTGDVELLDADGNVISSGSPEHFALCRCGHSRNKPFCSGMHYYVDFHDPVPDRVAAPSIFEWAGGLRALTRMTRLFYEKYVPADDLIGPVFARMSPDHPQRVAAWLGEVFGGPKLYSEPFGGYPHMITQHKNRQLTEEIRARWVQLLTLSAQEAGLPNDAEFRSAFNAYLEWGSRLAVENSQTDSKPPANMPMPHWTWTTAAGAPGSRISGLQPEEAEHEPEIVLPAEGEPVTFADHIKPLFRTHDRTSMLFALDLWDETVVKTHATAILARLRAGTMPCDGAWPADRIEVFARWSAARDQ